jgi:putative transposase
MTAAAHPGARTLGPALDHFGGRRYVQYISHTYGRAGTFWDSRFKSPRVQAETYLLLCQRYIELNPVRTGMVSDPVSYSWSSYRASALGKKTTLSSRLTPFTSPSPRTTPPG